MTSDKREVSSDEEDTPLSQTSKRRKVSPLQDSDDDISESTPESVSSTTRSVSSTSAVDVSNDEDDIALSQVSENVKAKSSGDGKGKEKIKNKGRIETGSRSKKTKVKSESSESSESNQKKARSGIKKIKQEENSKKAGGVKKLKKEENESESTIEEKREEEVDNSYKWWEANNDDDTIKWHTLKHNGVIFPPAYEPLPSHVKLYYGNQPVDLPVKAEEVAGFFAALLESDHAKNPVFQKNFFEDFLQVLKECGGPLNGVEVKSFDKCDFSKMFAYFELQKEQKKQLSSLEKKSLRFEREKLEEPFKFCELDGRKEQVGNFRIEPPGLFRGRGAHPKTGKLKRRVYPEDVVLNLDRTAAIPPLCEGQKWGEIRHDNTVQWLAMWRENISNSFKYVRFAASSSLNGQSDFKKFEKARQLKDYIDPIRADYRKNLKNKVMLERQKAVAIYLIDVFALRAGGEKSEDEADTVGCCSLRYEHVTLKPPNTVIFDFLGKDSIRFYQEVEVDKQVFKNLTIFKRPPKQPGHQLFDRLDPSILNKYLQNYMPGLTAKVFRTYNASKTMQDQLDLIPNEGTVAEKNLKYNAANRTVAILCNHQRSVTKNHAQSVQKANDRIQELEWQKIRLKRAILELDKSQLKKRQKFFEEIDDLTKEDEASIHKRVIEREIDRCHKKFARENEKRKSENEELLTESDLEEWLAKVEDKRKLFEKELKTNEIDINNATIEKLEKQIEKLEQRIEVSCIQLKDKEENSQVSLGTSKINYIDPRLSVVFCKKYGVPIEKIFTKSLREKFKWAIESVDENWRF
ncbi:hypothetical protein HG535_0G02820 [Zygotorulaspora mrakii]|uniref:DNA topoisomerase I n=1 Tax=Zygotorulaspora mrakii TaxID=42260 RepID=A0A7H9B8T0_ZYGMR|nr:uncharacterized protein HG535_0G02820 [Zygotorulaspora mrakii]QLG74399.1 hypothetical protein HG535_0G02820 [Zygotorulaspora mrakii]